MKGGRMMERKTVQVISEPELRVTSGKRTAARECCGCPACPCGCCGPSVRTAGEG